MEGRLGLIASAVLFLLGCLLPLELPGGGGRVFVGEAVLAFVGVGSVLSRRTWALLCLPWPRRLLCGLGLTFVGYVITDLLRETEFQDLSRGWANILVIGAAFVGLCWVSRLSHERVRVILLGWACSLAISGLAALSGRLIWKVSGFPWPLTIGVLIIGGKIGRRTLILLLVLAGTSHILLDFRSLGGLCLAVAVALTVIETRRGPARVMRIFAIGGAALVVGAVIVGSLSESSRESGKRRAISDSWRWSALKVAAEAIAESPWIGHGSWARDSESLNAQRQLIVDSGNRFQEDIGQEGIFSAHSQILQAWYQGGVLACAFFFFYIGGLVYAGRRILLGDGPPEASGLLLYVIGDCLWHVFMSPFNGAHREGIVLGMVICVMVLGSRRKVWNPVRVPRLEAVWNSSNEINTVRFGA